MLRKSILLILSTIVGQLLGVTPSSGCGKPLPSQPHAGHSHNFNAMVQDPNLGEVFDHIFHVLYDLSEYYISDQQGLQTAFAYCLCVKQ